MVHRLRHLLDISLCLARSGAAHNERLLAAGGTWRSLGVVGGGARHPSQVALAARLSTFERWPADRAQTPRTLADAGFFYTGTDDQVIFLTFFFSMHLVDDVSGRMACTPVLLGVAIYEALTI